MITIPSTAEALLAREIIDALGLHQPNEHTLSLIVETGEGKAITMQLPQVVSDLLKEILKQTAHGNAIRLLALPPKITTRQAADLLNVSERYVRDLIDKGQLSFQTAGNLPLLSLAHVLACKRDIEAKGEAASRELAVLDQELGLR